MRPTPEQLELMPIRLIPDDKSGFRRAIWTQDIDWFSRSNYNWYFSNHKWGLEANCPDCGCLTTHSRLYMDLWGKYSMHLGCSRCLPDVHQIHEILAKSDIPEVPKEYKNDVVDILITGIRQYLRTSELFDEAQIIEKREYGKIRFIHLIESQDAMNVLLSIFNRLGLMRENANHGPSQSQN